MRMEHTLIDDVLVLVPLEARIEAANSAAFKGAVVDWIHKGKRKIVLDLIHVEFIDSSGLGAIISSLKNLGKEGELALCSLSKPVINLFRLTRMQRIFQLFESREEAVSKLSH